MDDRARPALLIACKRQVYRNDAGRTRQRQHDLLDAGADDDDRGLGGLAVGREDEAPRRALALDLDRLELLVVARVELAAAAERLLRLLDLGFDSCAQLGRRLAVVAGDSVDVTSRGVACAPSAGTTSRGGAESVGDVRYEDESKSATVRPTLTTVCAALRPAGPPPTTSASKVSIAVR